MYKKILASGWQSMLLAALLFLYGVGIAWAQAGATSASITGKITEQSGTAISGATVKIIDLTKNLDREITTDTEGNYSAQQLTPGFYEVKVSADGFQSKTTRFELSLGTTARLDISLAVGAVSEVIEVNASTSFNEGKTESSNNVDTRRIGALPINRRTFLDFALTSARTVADRLPSQGVSGTSGLSFNGQAGRYNIISIDGVDNTDHYGGLVRTTFSQEAVQEFQVVTDGYSAEFGRSIGGVINIVTKGGGNDFHGNIFLLNRNDKISAREPFLAFRPPYSQYQFGSTLSGPIKKDKAFFFLSFERLTVQQNNVVTIDDTTVAAARRAGFPINNGARPFAVGNTALLARTDFRISPSNVLSVRYNGGFNYNGAYEVFGGNIDQSSSGIQNVDDNSLTVNNTYLNSSLNLINETRFLFSRRRQDVDPSVNGLPEVVLTGTANQSAFFGNQQFLPFNLRQNIVQFVDNVSLSRGAHQIKFGVDFQRISSPDEGSVLSQFGQGRYVFNPINLAAILGVPTAPTLSSFQAFDPTSRTPDQIFFLNILSAALPNVIPSFPSNVPLANIALPTIFIQSFGDPTVEVNAKFFSAYIQDDIKVKPNLTVKAGLRYDINRIFGAPDNNGNFGPRLGISYSPVSKVNLRASYGLFFGTPFIGPITAGQRSSTIPGQDKLKFFLATFPFAVLPFQSPTRNLPAGPQVPNGITLVPQLGLQFQIDKNLRNPYTQQVNAGFDYSINKDTVISLDYTYVRGLKVISGRNINPVVRPIPNDPTTSLIVGRVDPTRGQVFEYASAFDSTFNGGTVTLNRRFSNRFGILASYTLSKSIDNIVDIDITLVDQPNDPLQPGLERSLSLQDVRSRFVASGIWDLSYTKNPLLRDFQISAILNLNSGRPFNLVTLEDINMNGDGFLPSDRPFGLGRNLGLTPGFANLDMRLTRTIKFGERVTFQGFVEAFNLFNRVNFDPNRVDRFLVSDGRGGFLFPPTRDGRFVTTPNTRLGTFAPRQFQFGFKLGF